MTPNGDDSVTFSLGAQTCTTAVASAGPGGFVALLEAAALLPAVLFVDAGAPQPLVDEYVRALAVLQPRGMAVERIALTNDRKTLPTVEHLWDRLFDARADAAAGAVVIGGNVVLDAVGYACATFLRGVPVAYVPTTLLAQVDGAHGGATGIHHRGVTNLLGAWRLPVAVWVDPRFLTTLPRIELAVGMAEIVKQGLVGDASLLDELADLLGPGGLREGTDLFALVDRAVVSKQRIVAGGGDVSLNFGHTLGHAVESAAGHRGVRHGEAVAIGMVAVTGVAVRTGLASPLVGEVLGDLLRRFALPHHVDDVLPGSATRMRHGDIASFITRDKKVRDGRNVWVIAPEPGRYLLTEDVAVDDVVSLALAGRPARSA